ncbi:cysteine--tRNA ligase [Lysinibacter sp. HNR]|uniref:cysteine--tRNA ligase n=1 Tax=Lysinibacter sp. HNR TaxID=3031408 RepID=UPI002435E6AC|nr:cysteine--tRNA ligase [Lysinibacter sp. HNR]WGD38130.1 cysteine--tRNA ligase [Lysinibacter sp. HNR]
MTQRLYDSKTQQLVDFSPREVGKVGMYVCGPTVQSAPHIGHLRSALVYDQMRRWFSYRGLDVTLVRNVTDIEDKILDNAAVAKLKGSCEEWWALAYRIERQFNSAYDALGIQPPTYEPRATANIQQMIDLIIRIIERGHAYPADDGSANVYFDTGSWEPYGELTHQDINKMEPAADSDPRGKRNPHDFALWKAHKAQEPESAAWESPWGRGRPGWHIECSAMSTRYLGSAFDIHGGGLDLRFPHHENELAQSRAAGDHFATHWIHNGLVNVNGQKMSKSLGNSVFADDLLLQARPLAIRYFLGSAHYRSSLDYTPESLAEAEAALNRIEAFLRRWQQEVGGLSEEQLDRARAPEAFGAAMLDDFALPQALAVLHETVRAGNTALDTGKKDKATGFFTGVWAIVNVLGINPLSEHWSSADDSSAIAALETLVEHLLVERQRARENRDYETSDRIRDTLKRAGITLKDTSIDKNANGSHWSLNG